MAEVTCPSPFVAAGSLSASCEIGVVCPYNPVPTAITWNPADKHADIVLSEGNLRVDNPVASHRGVRATASKTNGKWYWEVKVIRESTTDPNICIGIGAPGSTLSGLCGRTGDIYGYTQAGGKKVRGASWWSYAPAYTDNDIIGIALDLDAGKIWWAKNNVWQASGDPAAGTNEGFSGISGTYFPQVSLLSSGGITPAVEARFKKEDQAYTPPQGFEPLEHGSSPFIAEASLSVDGVYRPYIDLDEAFSADASFAKGIPQPNIKASTFSSTVSGQANVMPGVSASAFQAVTNFSCDHCFNYAQIGATCPTPTCKMAAVFRYARLQAETPVPTASFVVGKRIEGGCPVPGFTCVAYHGRNPSIVASSPVPTCSMRVGLSLNVDAGAPVPTCSIVADTHHLVTLCGNVPTPICRMVADTENIAIINALAPCPGGLFTATVGNVANVYGRVPVPTCSMGAITGIVVSLRGRVPVPGHLVRFYASPMNINIALEGNVPVPTITSLVRCSLPSLVLRYTRGKVR